MMNPLLQRPLSHRWRGWLLAGLLVGMGLLGFFWGSGRGLAAPTLFATDPVTAAWEKAKAAGSYHFTSDVLQKTIPVASIMNVGRTSRSDALYLEGQTDLRAQSMDLTLWTQGGSVLNAESGVSLRTAGGKTFTRRGTEAWQESDNSLDTFAPQGDFLGYLAAIRNVSAGVAETRNGLTFTRYTFELDGPAFAAYMHKQLMTAMRAKGELPPGVELDVPAYYRDMTGTGELWVGDSGLPLRQMLTLRFPAQQEERLEASITVNFSNYGVEESSLWTLLHTGQWQGAWLVLPGRLPNLTGVWLGLALSVMALLVIRYRRVRAVQTALVSAVIASQVVGPVLSALTQTRFFDSYRAKAAVQEEKRAAAAEDREIQAAVHNGPAFDPHQNPLAAVDSDQLAVVSGQWESAPQSPNLSVSQSPSLQVTDPGTDTDRDGLTDFTEVRIGTSEVISDTDDDGLTDNLEVNGFVMGSQTWYLDPLAADSNRDGLADIMEWGINSTTGLPQATPRDTDGDGLPDLFDPDNDNDGVIDRLDSAPLAKGGVTYSEANPLAFSVKNLAADKPAFVEFQLRPQDPKNLWFAHNVLDWPQDSEGQVRDVDGATYADWAVAQGRTPDLNEVNGDLKLVPMLEIRIPTNSANLPSQAELTPFNISVNNFTSDGATKVAYVPLAIVTDEQSGERVAFSGQMRYQMKEGWLAPHNVRLAWVVQALNDVPCDPTAADAAAQGCQSDGYIHNVPSAIHVYYEDWTLTGLSVREDNGTSMAIVYEDPAVDNDKQENGPLWALATTVLDHHFLVGRDENNDGVRDLKLSDFPTRFDRDNSPSAAQRFNLPNILQVVNNDYTTGDAATAATITKTVDILDTTFKPIVQANNNIKPLLLFATENSMRAVGLDQVVAGENYATQSGANITLDLAPTAQSALPVTVQAGLKWMAYCGADGANVTWRPCTTDEYAGEIEGRYAAGPMLAGDGPYEVQGRMVLTLAYYFSLTQGYAMPVQEGPRILSARYSLEGESQTADRVRDGLTGLLTVPQVVLSSYVRILVGLENGGIDPPSLKIFKKFITALGEGYSKRKAVAAEQWSENVKTLKVDPAVKFQVRFVRLGALGLAGSVATILYTVVSFVPNLNTTARTILGSMAALITLATTVVMPTLSLLARYVADIKSGASPSLAKLFTGWHKFKLFVKINAGVGIALSLGLIWGFFIYSATTSGYKAGSPQLTQAAAEAVASSLVAILLIVLSNANVAGTLIIALIGVIDQILNTICEAGVKELRVKGNFYGNACFSFSTTATKLIAYFLYNYDLMVDTTRNDMVVVGVPQVTLADPSKGYVPSNSLSISMPVTTTVVHKSPDPSLGLYINAYLWLFSPDNLKSSTFKYALSKNGGASQPVDLNGMVDAWQQVTEDHKYAATPMYRGIATTGPAPLTGLQLSSGINQPLPFSLTADFAVPAYECWALVIPLLPVAIIPICYTREYETTTDLPFRVFTYDVFPETLAGFVALTTKANGAQGQSWDARFPALADADGDGLHGSAFNGLDPNDTQWDTDGDGLSDRFELEQRSGGAAFSPLQRDTDNDGLTDAQEVTIGTDPAIVDTDNDGLSDGIEVRHQVVGADGKLTATWAGGWQVTINSSPARTVWVSSNPFNADSDQDGISDQAERQLASQLDNQSYPYHPNVANHAPLTVLTESSDPDGYVAPNQSFRYTSTVIATTAVAPGVLNVTAPAAISSAPNPAALSFNSLTFTSSQTVTVASDLAIVANATSGSLVLTSTASTRLPNTSGPAWIWSTLANNTVGSVSAPFGLRDSALAANSSSRQDSYLFTGQSVSTSAPSDSRGLFPGDLFAYPLLGGATRQLDQDTDDLQSRFGLFTPAEANGKFLRGKTNPSVACNNAGQCMVVWEQLDYCNTATINSITVNATGDEPSVEPLIFLARDPNDNDPTNGGYEMLWTPAGNLGAGTYTGGNVNALPYTFTFCGQTSLHVSEWDTGDLSYVGPDPTQRNWGGMKFMGKNTMSPTNDAASQRTYSYSSSEGYNFSLSVNIGTPPSGRQRILAAAMLAPDGTISKPQFQLSPTTLSAEMHVNPAVTSDGTNFLVAWENLELGLSSASEINTRLYDSSGNPLTNAQTGIDRVSMNILSATGSSDDIAQSYADLDAVWTGSNYLVTRQFYPHNNVAINTLPNLLTGRRIGSTGTLVAGSSTTLVDDIATDTFDNHDLAWDPVHNNTLLVYRDMFNQIGAMVFGANNVGPFALSGAVGTQPQTAYHPASQSWLLSYNLGGQVEFRQYPTNLSASFVNGTAPRYNVNITTNNLACPAVASAPVVDLRLEELPGATTFVDSSGYGNSAVCEFGCPAAGLAGAPNAPLSDYAAKFTDGFSSLAVNTAFADSFTAAMWIKAPSMGSDEGFLVEQALSNARDWSLSLSSGLLRLRIGSQLLTATGARIDNDQWHFVAAIRNGTTGQVALYVDGAAVGTATFATSRLTNKTTLSIGRDVTNISGYSGLIDHLQLFRTSVDTAGVQALYNRTGQSYCVAGGVDSGKTRINWTPVNFTQQDRRGGRLTASNALRLIVDSTAPTANVTSVANGAIVGQDLVVGGTATDAGAGVAKVEVSINNGAWQPAEGAATWSFSLAGLSGTVNLQVRATDRVGNVGAPSAAVNVTIDTTPPSVTLTPPAGTLKPTKNATGQWQVPLSGTASDANGIKAGSILVDLTQTSGVGVAQSEQVATLSGNTWNLTYLLDPSLYDPTGSYTVTVQADDNAGNRTAATPQLVRLDTAGPVAVLSATDATREVISQTLTIGGIISDTNSIVGLDKAEIAFTPIDQIENLPPNLTSAQAEAQLNRTWLPVTLAGRGAGVAETTWSVVIPAGLENLYQIDLRGYDLLGNVSISAGLWRGMIDTLDPRVVFTTMPTGASYVDTADNTTRYAVQFLCAVQDRNLDESRFACPGLSLAEPIRSFDTIPALQTRFPDLTLRTGLAISYTLWTTTTTPVATASACDIFGRCTTTVAAEPLVTARRQADSKTVDSKTVAAASTSSAAAPGAPFAVVVNPTEGSFVAAHNTVSVTVAAEAGALLKTVVIKLDNATVQTLNFTQAEAVTRTVRTLNLPVATEGQHTLVAQATAWDNSTQTSFFPVVFTVDQQAPTVTLDPSTLTIANTWVAQSGVLRFHGNASDSVGLAAVQIKEGDGQFIDATFGGGTWRVALPVADPEGRTLTLTVRAIDRVGRITVVTQTLSTNLSAVDAPDTTILSGPANPSPTNSASFVVTGTVSAVVFDCQLDDGPYTPCGTTVTYSDLSKGSHTVRVRALDGRGYPDLSPAEYTWKVNPTALDATITSQPTNPTTSRTAAFTFSGTGSSLECSLDGAVFSPCTSPTTYRGLSNGEHTFQVRARSGNEVGAAARYVWMVVNAAPVATGQTVNTSLDTTVAISLTASDDDGLSYRLTQPSNGLLLGIPPALTYAPNTGFVGQDSFSFVATDGEATSNVATITVTVAGSTGTAVAPTVSIARNNSDIVLNWTPNGANSGYAVHRGTTPSFTPDGTTLLTTLGADATGYTDAGTAPTPSSGYYYVVRAVAGVSTADATPVAALSYTLNNAGGQYSLLGLPFLPTGVSDAAGLATTIGSVSALLAWNPATQTMRFFAPPSSGDNFTLTPGMAIFVVVNSGGPSSVTLTGVVGSLPQMLTPNGFTFITVPLDQGALTSASALAAAIGEVSALLAWNPATQTFRFFTPPSSGDDFAVQPGMPVVISLPAGSPITWPAGN